MRFHEDGARTKALLGKVRQPAGRSADTGSPAGAWLAPGPAARQAFIVATNDGRGASGKVFPAFALPHPGIPRLYPCEIALASCSWRNRGSNALGPSSTGSTESPLILRLFGSRRMISEVPVQCPGIINVCRFPQISDLLAFRGFYSFASGRLLMSTVNQTFWAFLRPCSQKGEVVRSLGP